MRSEVSIFTNVDENLSLSRNVLPATGPFCSSFDHFWLSLLPFIDLLVAAIKLPPGYCHFLFFLPRVLSSYGVLGAPLL